MEIVDLVVEILTVIVAIIGSLVVAWLAFTLLAIFFHVAVVSMAAIAEWRTKRVEPTKRRLPRPGEKIDPALTDEESTDTHQDVADSAR